MNEVDVDRTILESILYAQIFKHTTMVVKLGKKVTEKAREERIISDINLLQKAGISMILFYEGKDNMHLAWPSIKNIGLPADSSRSSIDLALKTGKIPVIRCNSNGKTDQKIADLAVQLGAQKVIFMTHHNGVYQKGEMASELTTEEAQTMLDANSARGDMQKKLSAAICACQGGVERVHIINGRQGTLLQELLTAEGVGTMIFKKGYQGIRPANIGDVSEIESLMRTLNFNPCFESLEKDIGMFFVYAVDNIVYGCMKLNFHILTNATEISHLAIPASYQNSDVLREMLEYAMSTTRDANCEFLFLQPEKNNNWLGVYPWFWELGFSKTTYEHMGMKKHGNPKQKIFWLDL